MSSHSVIGTFPALKLTHQSKQPPRRVIVQDIYLGPVFCGMVTLQGGKVKPVTQDIPPFEHPFIELEIAHAPAQRKILAILDLSSDGFDFQHRLLADGFDLAAPASTHPISISGRCWRLLSPAKELLGALWDTPGRLGSLISGYSVKPMHPHATLSIYFSPDDQLFGKLQRIFDNKKFTIADLRREIQLLGIFLLPHLYELF
ncbi:hypothetical protein BLNAU_335 [Blattamonas nauphoetae]|uniref:Uncharacterized protein n=1 Tax=Blattamonas nauphoetae TaxID=2049346 RepID=A0ABQ9YKZ7_9EUKA|nr:hypothetical protein BLNAU_335 [Blattamonas nauphoetae]